MTIIASKRGWPTNPAWYYNLCKHPDVVFGSLPFRAEIVEDEAELQAKARAFEASYDALNYRDDQFDLSDAALSVCMAMLAVTALTRKRWLLAFSWAIAFVGLVMGVAGLLALKLHPTALVKLLS